MIKHTTEYLIMHEDDLNWEELSKDKDDFFNLIEIRLFRSKIDWAQYFAAHTWYCPMTTEMLEIASKYFTAKNYSQLAFFGIATEDFILKHPEKFNWEEVIKNIRISEENLLKTKEYWESYTGIKYTFLNSKKININLPEYERIKLLLELDDED